MLPLCFTRIFRDLKRFHFFFTAIFIVDERLCHVGKVNGLAKGTQRDSTSQVAPNSFEALLDSPTTRTKLISNGTGLLVLTQFLFGMSYVPSKIMVEAIPPLVWVTLRTWISALIITAIAFLWRGPPPRLTTRDVMIVLGLAFVGGSFNQAAFMIGLEKTTTANSAILSCLIPVFTLLLSILLGRERWSWNVFASFLFAFLGAMLVVDVTRFNLDSRTVQGDLWVILNAVSYAMFLAFGGDFMRRFDRLWATALIFIAGSAYLTLASAHLWPTVEWPVFDYKLTLYAIYAVVGAVTIPYILVNIVLVSVPPSRIALFVFLQPVIAGVTGWILLGTVLTWTWAAGALLVMAGVLLSQVRALMRKDGPKVVSRE